MVGCPFMVRWVVRSIPHGRPFEQVIHDWCNKGCGMCYPLCGMMHVKRTLAANWKE